MKRFLKKLAKKSLALLMVCLTLVTYMSLLAPVHKVYAASDSHDYSLDDLYSTYLTDSAINSTGAGFATPSFSGTAVSSGNFANILRSGNYTASNAYSGNISVTSTTSRGNCDKANVYVDWDWHVAADTAVLIDGVTKPQIPVLLSADPQGNDKVTVSGSWPSTGNFSMKNSRWYGRKPDESSLKYNDLIGSTSDGLDGIKNASTGLKYTKNNEATQTAGVVLLEGGYSGWVSTVKLDFVGITDAAGDHPGTTSTSTNGPYITVVNYLPLKQALTEAKSYIETAVDDKTKQEYTDASKEALRVVVNQLIAAKPDTTYFNGNSKFNYANYEADAQAAVDAWTAWKNTGFVRQYNITWNIEGVKTTVKVVNGVTPVYTGATPTKASDNTYDYTFDYWSPAPSAAVADAEYTAVFESIKRYYTVTFKGADGTVLQTGDYEYNATVSAPNAPAIANKEFKEWSPAFSATVTGNATYTATYEDLYTVTFKNYDGSVIGTSQVKYGQAAKAPSDPTKPADADNEYVFSGWNKDFSSVTGNMEVTATFNPKGHENIQTTVTQQPTCTTGAMVVRYCADCGYQWNGGQPYEDTSVAAPLGHSFEGENPTFIVQRNGAKTETTHTVKCTRCTATTTMPHEFQVNQNKPASDANCITPGEVYEICPDCLYERTVDGGVNENKHDNTTTVGYQAPACGVPGYTGDTYCNDCKKTVEHGEPIPALEHSYTNYKSNGDATCTADGTKTALCDHGCGEKDTVTDVGSMIDHKYTNYVYNDDATCLKDGTETAVCDYGCGVGVDTRDKVGTKLDHIFEGEHKSNGDGTHSFLCTLCEVTYGGTVDCTYDKWVAVDGEYHKHTCTICSYTPEATGHVWSDWEPVSGEAGKQTRYCTLCDYVDKKSCTYTEKYTDPTCEDDAYTTYSCPECGHGYTVTHKDTKLGHKFDGAYKFDANTDKHQQACSNGCGSYGIGTTKDEWADCVWTYVNKEAGEHTATCVCGNSEVQACTGGTATCTEQAVCQFCHTAYGTTAPHSYTGTVVNIERGKHAYLCEFCDDATHYGVGAEKDATEACSGGSATCIKYAECEKCHEEYGEYAAHTFNGTPVALEGDVHAYRCSVCNDETIYGVGNEVNKTKACSGGEATCTNKAVCDICKDTHGEIDPDAHKWTEWANVDGTETHSRYCEYDNTHTQTQDCFSSSPAVAAPDCNTAGFTLHTCEDCGHTWQTDPVPALGHDWGEWVNNGDGSHTRTCKRECGYADNTQTEYCLKTDAKAVVTRPTCTENGYTTYTCNVCGYVWVDGDDEAEEDYVAPLGHTYKEQLPDEAHLKTPADCENAAVYWYDCINCEKNAKDETDFDKYPEASLTFTYGKALGHKLVNVVADKYLATEATCFAAAKYYTSCQNCGKSSLELYGAKATTFSSGTALAHIWVKPADEDLDEYLASSADCANAATYYYVCSLCGESSKDYGNGATWEGAAGAGHKLTYTAANAATCTADGNYEYWYCSVCNKYFKNAECTETFLGLSETVIDALKHEYVTVKAEMPTCTTDGHPAYKYCKNCETDNGYPGEIPDGYKMTGHNFIGTWTCDEANDYHSRMCINCNDANGMMVDGAPVEYKFENGTAVGGVECTFTFKATTKDGVHTHAETCVCGNGQITTFTDDQTIDNIIAPNCTDKGYEEHSCKVDGCGATWTKNEVPALGHLPGSTVTPNGDGTHSYECQREDCNYKTGTEKCSGGTATCSAKAVCSVCGGEYGEKGTHVFDETKWERIEATECGKKPTEKNTCTVENCGEVVIREIAGSEALKHTMSPEGYTVPAKLAQLLADKGIEIKEPTCAAEGLSISYCTNGDCTYYITKIVKRDSNGHIWETDENGDLVWSDPQGDCATGVTSTNKCTVCGTTQSKTELGTHSWELKLYSEPTCIDIGYRIWKCTTCSFECKEHYGYNGEYLAQIEAIKKPDSDEYYRNSELKPLEDAGHVYTDTGKTQAATCTEAGKSVWKCVHCGKFDYRTDANGALGHKLYHYEAREADCVYEGNIEYWSCSRCNETYADEAGTMKISAVTVPTVAHADNDGDTKCDKCNRVLYSNDDGHGSCGCICHKNNFLMKIIYNIVNFFWKLFKISKTCDCGNVHW